MFRINDTAHHGCLKIGEATCEDENVFGLSPNSKALNEAARKRINQYTQTAGIAYDLLYTELTVYNRGGLRSFNDKEVHNVLERSGIKKKVFDTVNKANEWFITDLETVKRAIAAVKEGRSSLSSAEVTREPRLYSGRNNRKPSTRLKNSSEKVTRGSGTQRCVSERPVLLCRLSRIWSFSVP